MEKIKKLALISSYCDTKEKLEILKINLLKLKELGVDSFLFTPISLPLDITNLSTHVLLSKENPILKAPERVFTNWVWSTFNGIKIKNVVLTEDYGWASLNQLKRLAQYSSNLDYDLYYPMIYDLNIDDRIKNIINSNQNNLLFPNRHYRDDKSYFEVGAIFSCFSKEKITTFGKVLNKQSYLMYDTAELYLEAANKALLNLKITDIVTEDLIYNDKDNFKYHNVSFSPNLKIFINNYRYLGVNLYDVEKESNIIIKVNNESYTKKINSHHIFLSNLPLEIINSISISIDGEEKDFSYLLPQNINTRFEIKIEEETSWEYVKDFVYLHKISF